MGGERCTGFAVARDDVDHTFGQARFHTGLGQCKRGKRRIFGRLQHHGVSGGQGGRNLPRQHEQREVPRNDLAAYAHGAMTRELALDQLRPAGVMIKMPGHQRHVDIAALADGLAVVHGLEHGEKAFALLDVAGQRIEMFRAGMARKLRPGGKGLARRLHGGVDISRCPLRHTREAFARRRIVDIDPL